MVKLRLLLFLSTIIIVGIIGYFLTYYAKGYRLDPDSLKLLPNGILVIKSNPDSAQVFLNDDLKTATNATINLPPGLYDVTIRKDGFSEWSKKLTIQKEVVTDADAHLFRVAPSLSAVTFSGVFRPLSSPDFTKIAYIVPSSSGTEKAGLWLMETVNLPLGFSRDPRRITDGNLDDAHFTWSPDGRQILLSTKDSAYLLDTGVFTEAASRVNVLTTEEIIKTGWEEEETKRLDANLNSLPKELSEILKVSAKDIVFAPDESKILYTASESAQLPPEIIKPIPGASTQAEERNITPGHTYVYDLKEDRNFLVDREADTLSIESWKDSEAPRHMFWFATSRHLVLAEDGRVIIMDLDGTNRQIVYSGSFVAPYALVAPSTDRLFILTNLGAGDTTPNIYSLGLK